MTKITYGAVENRFSRRFRRVFADGNFVGKAENRRNYWAFTPYNSDWRHASSIRFADLGRYIVENKIDRTVDSP